MLRILSVDGSIYSTHYHMKHIIQHYRMRLFFFKVNIKQHGAEVPLSKDKFIFFFSLPFLSLSLCFLSFFLHIINTCFDYLLNLLLIIQHIIVKFPFNALDILSLFCVRYELVSLE